LRGANVSNIDVRVGEAGVLTTLKMQTFTPKFLGIFGKDNASVLSKLGQREHKLRRTIRANRRPKPPPEIFSQLNPDFFGGHMGRTGVGTSKSAHPILVGQQINYNSNTEQRTNIRFMSFEESKTELGFNYDSKSFSSLDCLFRPISTEVGYANPTGYTGSGSLTRPCLARNAMEAIPPFKTQPDLDAGYINLDPFLNPGKGLLSSNNAGHDIEYMIHSNEMIDDVHIRLTSDYGVGYRTFGLRAPLVLTGWGLDLEGKPVPNSTPNTPSDTYADNWLKKPTNWKTGPLDLRWDENRGVWTSWPGYKLLKIEFDTALAEHGVANATVLDDVTQYGAGGDVVGKTIEVTGCLDGQIASDGDQALAYYDTRTCSYCPILSAGGGSNIVEGLLKEGMPEGDLCEGTDAILSLYGLGGTECLDFVNNACDNTSISSTDNYGDLNTAVSVINRDVTLSAGINAFCIAEFINGEYRPVYIGCPPCPISGCIEATATVPLTSSQTSSSLVAFGNLTVSDAPS